MYSISYFGQTIQANGTINEALAASGTNVPDDQDAYVNGQAVSRNSTPTAGSTVTFRPRASGKA